MTAPTTTENTITISPERAALFAQIREYAASHTVDTAPGWAAITAMTDAELARAIGPVKTLKGALARLDPIVAKANAAAPAKPRGARKTTAEGKATGKTTTGKGKGTSAKKGVSPKGIQWGTPRPAAGWGDAPSAGHHHECKVCGFGFPVWRKRDQCQSPDACKARQDAKAAKAA
jgi:hypothetical protein